MGKNKDRSRSPKKHRRDRSSDRKRSSHQKIREERGKKRKTYEKDERNHRSSEREQSSTSSQKAEKVQRGIDAAKNRLRASLSTAITTLSEKQSQSASAENTDFSSTLSVMNSLSRQIRIEEIEEEGFRPSSFTCGNNVDNLSKVKSRRGEQGSTSSLKQHDKAMFGPMWASREIEQKQLKAKPKEGSLPPINPIASNPEAGVPHSSLAHPILSANPEERQKKWIELFQRQRKALISGK